MRPVLVVGVNKFDYPMKREEEGDETGTRTPVRVIVAEIRVGSGDERQKWIWVQRRICT